MTENEKKIPLHLLQVKMQEMYLLGKQVGQEMEKRKYRSDQEEKPEEEILQRKMKKQKNSYEAVKKSINEVMDEDIMPDYENRDTEKMED